MFIKQSILIKNFSVLFHGNFSAENLYYRKCISTLISSDHILSFYLQTIKLFVNICNLFIVKPR